MTIVRIENVSSSSYPIKLDGFEGPLDLLLHLVDQSEIDIHSVSITEIADQYIEYVHAMQELQLDVAGEFLVMASYLLSIKSKRLLPRPIIQDDDFPEFEDEEAIREALLMRLEHYRQFKKAAEALVAMEEQRNLLLTRPPILWQQVVASIPPFNPVHDVSIYALLSAFKQVLDRAEHGSPVGIVTRDEVSIRDRIVDVLRQLRQCGGKLFFHQLFSTRARRSEIVATFLSILELIKAKRVRCVQEQSFAEIYIESMS